MFLQKKRKRGKKSSTQTLVPINEVFESNDEDSTYVFMSTIS